MPSPSEKLADSLEALQKLQKQGFVAIRSTDLSRTHRERLSKHGFLQEVMKGWYIPAHPDGNHWRKYCLVRLFLGLLRGIFHGAICFGLVSVTRAIPEPACR